MDYNQIYKLANILAIKYLSKYSINTNKLKEYLIKKITKIHQLKNDENNNNYNNENEGYNAEIDKHNLNIAIDNLIIKLTEMGYINDKVYAQTKKNNLKLAGKSTHYIKLKLQEKGIEKELIEDIFSEVNQEDDNLLAIIKTIKIKRFFGFRTKNITEENLHKQNEKEIASLFRQGFNYDIIKQVKDKTSDEILELLEEIENNQN